MDVGRDGVRFWIVPHTHWDREWYQPFQVFRLRLARMVDELMDTLDADASFTTFTLDGQAVLLEDYLAARPESEARLSGLIREGRIRVGPSYVLPDEFLVGPESLVRNLLLGRRTCRRYGREMPVAYYPDTFGHVAQMPQIVRGFGMESFVFWRGLGDEADRLGAVFRWRAPDGSEVVAVRQLSGYAALDDFGNRAEGPCLDRPAEKTERALCRLKQLREAARAHLERSGVVDLLLGNGNDHQRVQQDLPSLLAACRLAWPEADFHIAGLAEYMDAIDRQGPPAVVYEGELCGGRDAAVLRGVNSTRIPLKQRNEAVERALLEAETACSLAHLAGAPYPAEDLRLAWRHLLRNHPHDSICGCSVDEVHRDMAWRFDAAEHLALRLRREALARLAGEELDWSSERELGTGPGEAGSAVNLLPWARRGVVELPLPRVLSGPWEPRAEGPRGDLPVQVVRRGNAATALVVAEAPGFGACPIRLAPAGRLGPAGTPAPTRAIGMPGPAGTPAPTSTGARLAGDRAVENEHYRVEVREDGTLDVTHRASSRRISGAHWFEDDADRGDEYNFCPVEGEARWDSRRLRVRVRPGLAGPAVASLILEVDGRLPSALRSDRRARKQSTVACPIRTEVRLASGIERVEFVTTVENRAEDHRLRVLFPAPAAEEVRVEGHFAVLGRPVGRMTTETEWMEPPAATHHTLGAVEAAGVAVFGRGLPEYEARRAGGGTELALTLLRCVGWLSRNDLATRPQGWAGPGIPTPEAQCPGGHRFEYALALPGDIPDAGLVRASQDYRFGLLSGPPSIPEEPPVRLAGDGFCFAALKGAEDGGGCVLRVYNPDSAPSSVAVVGDFAVEACRMDEEPEGEPSPLALEEGRGEGTFSSALPGGRIATFRLRRRLAGQRAGDGR